MQIIDFEKKGNVVRFYLGDFTDKPWGDDWNDRPYECNAGTVYDEYIKGYQDIAFPFDDLVLEPCDGVFNSSYSKKDMLNRRIPCIIVIPKKIYEDDWPSCNFKYWKNIAGVKKYFFGDYLETDDYGKPM